MRPGAALTNEDRLWTDVSVPADQLAEVVASRIEPCGPKSAKCKRVR